MPRKGMELSENLHNSFKFEQKTADFFGQSFMRGIARNPRRRRSSAGPSALSAEGVDALFNECSPAIPGLP
jgi:hypothetical protein